MIFDSSLCEIAIEWRKRLICCSDAIEHANRQADIDARDTALEKASKSLHELWRLTIELPTHYEIAGNPDVGTELELARKVIRQCWESIQIDGVVWLSRNRESVLLDFEASIDGIGKSVQACNIDGFKEAVLTASWLDYCERIRESANGDPGITPEEWENGSVSSFLHPAGSDAWPDESQNDMSQKPEASSECDSATETAKPLDELIDDLLENNRWAIAKRLSESKHRVLWSTLKVSSGCFRNGADSTNKAVERQIVEINRIMMDTPWEIKTKLTNDRSDRWAWWAKVMPEEQTT